MADPRMKFSTGTVVSKGGLISCSCCEGIAWLIADSGMLFRMNPITLTSVIVKKIDNYVDALGYAQFKAFGNEFYFCNPYFKRYDAGGNQLLHLAVPCVDFVVANDKIFMACSDGTMRIYSLTGTLIDSITVSGFMPYCVDAKYVNSGEYPTFTVFFGGTDVSGYTYAAAIHCVNVTSGNLFSFRWHWTYTGYFPIEYGITYSKIYATRDGLDSRCGFILSADYSGVKLFEVELGVCTWDPDVYYSGMDLGWIVTDKVSENDIRPNIVYASYPPGKWNIYNLYNDTWSEIACSSLSYYITSHCVPVVLSDASIVSHLLICEIQREGYGQYLRLFSKSNLSTPILTKTTYDAMGQYYTYARHIAVSRTI